MPRVPILRGILPRLARPLLPVTRSPLLTHTQRPPPSFFRSFYTSRPRLTSPPPSPSPSKEPQTLSTRLKTLIKTYGWYALGVYLIIGVFDFGIAFAAINLLGADHVAHLAASIKSFFLNLIGRTPAASDAPDASPPQAGGSEGTYAMLVLAYTIHKTLFVPLRVGLTAAVTPRFVGWLGRRGWTGSDGARRAAQEVRERVRRGSRSSSDSSRR